MTIHKSAQAMGAAMNKLLDGFKGDARAVLVKTFFDLGAVIIESTPVDTGRARKGWIPSNEAPSNDVPPPGDYEEMKGSSPDMPQDVFKPEASSWWWSNHVEYIEDLENGSSRQAPTGFVANQMDRMTAHLTEQLKRVKFR